MTRGYVPRPVRDCRAGDLGTRCATVFCLALVLLLAAMSLPLLADGSATAPAPAAGGSGDFGQYLADHQADLAPFFDKNSADIFRLAVPMVLGMLGWVIVITMLVGWGVDILMSRGFAYFFAPAFAEVKRSVIYATGRLFLSFVYTGLLTLAIVFSLKFIDAGIIMGVAVTILLFVALAAQLVWILYLYRTNFAVSALFYLAIIAVHTVLGLVIAQPVIGFRANTITTAFVDQAITPRLKAEADSLRQQLDAANSDRNSVRGKVADLQMQITQGQADAEQLRQEIEAKKTSDLYVFSQIVQARARGEFASARDQLAAFLIKYPNSSVDAMARAQLDEINSQLSVQTTQRKQQEADTAHAAAVARADLLARAARGAVTLSEMRETLIGKSRNDVKNLLGLPMDTGTDTWGYRQQMIVNPVTNEKYGLTIYFSEGTVQGVDYDRNVIAP
jgi:hypothetical protein